MKLRPLFVVVVCASLFAGGCGNPEPTPVVDAGPVCDPAKCAEGNICVQDRCMLECQRAMDCPDGYDCRDLEGEGTTVCVANDKKFGKGGYGFGCGVNTDADCARTDGFFCHGQKDSADAYCTTTCETDEDCPGSFWCKDINIGPQQLRKTCIKREYCAPAKTLGDCADEDAVLATDIHGNSFCTVACDPRSENPCGFGNECVSVNGGQCWPRSFNGKRQCFPEEKKFCGRCISDADCPGNALCFDNEWTREKFCLQPCGAGASCPAVAPGGKQVSCVTFNEESPLNVYGGQCLPEAHDRLGYGCWFPRFN